MKKPWAIFFAALTLLFILVIKRTFDGMDWMVFPRHFLTLGACLGFSFIYAIVSALSWKMICGSQKVSFSFKESLKIVWVSSLIDVALFPSRISSDVYRASQLKEHGLRTSVQVVAAYRIGKIIPYLILTPLLLIKHGAMPGKTILFLTSVIAIGWYLSRKIPQLLPYWKPLGLILALNILLIFTEYTRTYLLLNLFHPFVYQDMLVSFLLSNSAGAISGIPLGLGAKDVSWGLFLKSTLTASQLALFLLLLRLTGEFSNALIGWIFSGREILQWLRKTNAKENREQ